MKKIIAILACLLVFCSWLAIAEEPPETPPECISNSDCPDKCQGKTLLYNGICDVDICSYTTKDCVWGCSGGSCADFQGNCPNGYCNTEIDCGNDYCSGIDGIVIWSCNLPLDAADCEGTCKANYGLCSPGTCENGACLTCGSESQVCCSGNTCNSGLYCSSEYCCTTGSYWSTSDNRCIEGEDECNSPSSGYNLFNTPTWYYYGYSNYYGATGNYACCNKDGANPIIRYGQPGNYFLPITVY